MVRFLLLLPVLFLTGCAAFDTHWNWDSFPGAHRYRHCKEYAESVTAALKRAHVEAYYTVYDWYVPGITNDIVSIPPRRGAHAVVIFRNTTGMWFIVDNDATPVPVNPGTRWEMIWQFSPYATGVRPDK